VVVQPHTQVVAAPVRVGQPRRTKQHPVLAAPEVVGTVAETTTGMPRQVIQTREVEAAGRELPALIREVLALVDRVLLSFAMPEINVEAVGR
jgi:hypothetical protein